MEKILIIDDDVELSNLIEEFLGTFNYQTKIIHEPEAALKFLEKNSMDLIILDIMLPGIDGFQTLRKIREESQVPVIMLTAKGEEVDRVLGFELGADDYVVKPFSVRELALRVSTVLKRRQKQDETSKITLGDIEINLSSYRVFISDTEIQLTAKEFLLFKHLVQKNGRIQPREVLLEEVWGYNSSVTTRTVDTHVKRLRSKIGDIGSKIETVRGVGYRFNYVV